MQVVRANHEMNRKVAEQLRQMADLLSVQGANRWRVAAFRRAADLIAGLEQDVAALTLERGLPGLTDLPGIGPSIASAVREVVATGRWSRLERLRGQTDPARLFQVVPGLGPELAERIHDHLDADTLEALESAAHDGRLEEVPGVGPRRAAMIRAALASVLKNRRSGVKRWPDVDVILDVDAEYRKRAAAGDLPTIAPRRFNPDHEAWLPILHTDRDRWHFSALFSNSARAHQLGREHDWVVISYEADGVPEERCTVVTETSGPLRGRRVVRGREAACRSHHRARRGSPRGRGESRTHPRLNRALTGGEPWSWSH